jgi:hypothetical protein
MSKIGKIKLNKGLILALGILAILAFSFTVLPKLAGAAAPRNYTYGSNYDAYGERYVAPTPTPILNSLSPNSAIRGTNPRTVTISGSGFIPSSVARVNNSNRATTFIDPTHLFVQLTTSDMNSGGFYITVYNGGPGGGYSNAVYFAVNPGVTNNSNNSYNYNQTTTYEDNETSYVNTYEVNENNNDTNNNDGGGNDLAASVLLGDNSFLPSGLIQWILVAVLVMLIVILVRKLFGAEERYHAAPLKHE